MSKSLAQEQSRALPREIGVWSAASLVVGTVIGAGIFLVPSIMAAQLPSATAILAVWVLGGILSYFGALAYAELGTMFPATGGQYVFLRESFGPAVAFLCGWTLFLVVMPGIIAALATGFATYLGSLVRLNGLESRAVAIALIVAFTLVNYRGLKPGIWVQNTFTVLKLAGIAVLAAAAFLSRAPSHLDFSFSFAALSWRQSGMALVAALVAYEGWNNLSFVNGEIRDPNKNIPRALALGVVAVGAVYILTTSAYMRVLPLNAIAASSRVGRDVATVVFGSAGAILLTGIILISILGSTNGNVLAAPRLYFAQANDDLFFRSFGRVHPVYKTPYVSILVQGVSASLLAITGSYELVATFSIFCAWVFYLLVVIGLIILRWKRPSVPRSYRMWGYPLTPLVFAAVTVWFLMNSVIVNPLPSLAGLGILLAGIPTYALWKCQPSVAASRIGSASQMDKIPREARPTTLIRSVRLNERLGIELVLASETFQHTGSFKFRAAWHLASEVREDHLITASSGNFGQALALACRALSKRCTVVMPTTSAAVKMEAVRHFGGYVEAIDLRVKSRDAGLAELALKYPGAYVVNGCNDHLLIAGNSSLGRELAQLAKDIDVIVAPVGGGALCAGILTGLRQSDTAIRVLGAEPLLANDAARSLRAGKLVCGSAESDTIADGARATSLGSSSWEILRDGIAGILEVPEDAIREAVRLLFDLANLKVEPTGALALAAVLEHHDRFYGQRVCCVISGGNVDPEIFYSLISGKS